MKALGEVMEPSVLEVHVDNEMAVQNLSRLASNKALKYHAEKKDDKHFVVTMTTDGTGIELPENLPACTPDLRGNTVIAISSDSMGEGSEELGKTLMKGFIYALNQLAELPNVVLFYNGGAYLTTEGSDSLEDIKNLEAQGVEILTCGTCLNYYGLTEKLQVGQATNMYSIVETLAGASKVIKP
jgi:selenium metabolism protein YedF